MKPELGQEINLSIRNLGIFGEGVGDFEGFTVFVDGALPQESVKARIYELKKNYARATLVSCETASVHRVTPPCPVFGRCGGCQLQHLNYEAGLEWKRQRVIDAFERIGKLKIPVAPCVPSTKPYGYRNKIQLPCLNNKFGLYAFHSHDIVEIERCLIHCPLGEKASEEVFSLLRRLPLPSLEYLLIKTSETTEQVLITLVTQNEGPPQLKEAAEKLLVAMPQIKGIVQNIRKNQSNVILGPTFKTLAGKPYIEERLCSTRFKISPASFFQVNPPQAEQLYQTALNLCRLTGSETLFDAYCGVGTLSLILAPHVKKVIGVDCTAAAISDAKENATLNGIENATFHAAEAESFINTLSGIDIALLNPPRKGCDPLFLNKLASLAPNQIIYISCDPATLARDLALLYTKGYTAEKAQPFDMFPQTVHVETLVLLKGNWLAK